MNQLYKKLLLPWTQAKYLSEIAKSNTNPSIDIFFWWFFEAIIPKGSTWVTKTIPGFEKASLQEFILDSSKGLVAPSYKKDKAVNSLIRNSIIALLKGGLLDNKVVQEGINCRPNPNPVAAEPEVCDSYYFAGEKYKANPRLVINNTLSYRVPDYDRVIDPKNYYTLPVNNEKVDESSKKMGLLASLIDNPTVIDNPMVTNKRVNPTNTDCMSCHMSPIMRFRSQKQNHAMDYKNPRHNLTVITESQNVFGQELHSSQSLVNFGSVRHFGYLGYKKSISARTINESAEAADLLTEMYQHLF